MKKSGTGFIIFIAAAAALGGFLFGFDTAVISGAVLALRKYFDATALQIGLAVSLALIGSAGGALSTGGLANRIGRVKTMWVAAALFFASALGSGLPFGLLDFIFWRMVGGVAVGMASVVAPAYIAEIAPANIRGRLGSLQQFAIVIGIFIAGLSAYGIASVGGGAEYPAWFGKEGWRWMFWSEAPVALLYGLFALFLPESPRYLAASNRDEEAAAIFEKIMGSPEAAKQKVAEIKASLNTEHKPKFSDVFGKYGLLPIVWIGLGLSVLQQFVGINVIFYYGTALWRVVGFAEGDALLITVITGIVNIVTTIIAIIFVDRIGRKPLLMVGSTGMALALGMLTFMFVTAETNPATGQPVIEGTAGIISLISANLYVFFFGLSWGPIIWVML
ncbi:MAG: sugar porter family MFS transporter, partial [Verrucomicrobiota bacterium]